MVFLPCSPKRRKSPIIETRTVKPRRKCYLLSGCGKRFISRRYELDSRKQQEKVTMTVLISFMNWITRIILKLLMLWKSASCNGEEHSASRASSATTAAEKKTDRRNIQEDDSDTDSVDAPSIRRYTPPSAETSARKKKEKMPIKAPKILLKSRLQAAKSLHLNRLQVINLEKNTAKGQSRVVGEPSVRRRSSSLAKAPASKNKRIINLSWMMAIRSRRGTYCTAQHTFIG